MGFTFVTSPSVQRENEVNCFHFNQRRVRVDWKKLASIDLHKISRELDFEALQNNIFHITFCDINAEIDSDSIDENFLKLFRLAQMIIEYLLYSQEQLAKSVTGLEEKLATTTEEFGKYKAKEQNETRRRKRNNAKMVFTAQEAHKCSFCCKAFLNGQYLQLHLQRRHNQSVAVKEIPEDTKPSVRREPVNEQELNLVMKEIKELREGLETKDGKLSEERNAMTSLIKLDLEDIVKRETNLRKEMEIWKREQMDVNKKELGGLCEAMMKELHEVQQRLQQMNTTADPKSNVGLLIDEDEINAELLKRQQQEWAKVQVQLQDQFEHIEKRMQASLQAQEERIGQKFTHLFQQNYQQLENVIPKIYDSFQRKPEHVAHTSMTTGEPEMIDKGITVEQGISRKQKKPLKAAPSVEITSNEPIFQMKEKVKKKQKPRIILSKPKEIPVTRNDVINKELLSALREDVSDLLQERLSDLGIQNKEGGLSDKIFLSKLESQKRDSQFLSQKYPSFTGFRQRIQSKLEGMLSSHFKVRSEPKMLTHSSPRAITHPIRELDKTYPPITPVPAPRKAHALGSQTVDFTSGQNMFKEINFTRIGNDPLWGTTSVMEKPPHVTKSQQLNDAKDNRPATSINSSAPPKPSRSNSKPTNGTGSDKSMSDLDDILNRISSSPAPPTSAGNAKDNESSSTSIWGPSGGDKAGKMPISNYTESITSWDSSEDDISEIKLS